MQLAQHCSMALFRLTVVTLLVACAPGAPAATTAPAPPAAGQPAAASGMAPAPVTPAKVMVGRAGAGSAPQFWAGYVAVARGYFTQEGIDYDTIAIPTAYTLTQSVISGDTQVVNFTVLSMAAAVAGGAPLKFVASAQDIPNLQLVVAPENRTWADLRGKVMGSGNSPGDYFDVVLRKMMAANGLQDGDYVVRTMPSNARMPSLAAGQVAGTILSDQNAAVALAAGNRSLGYVHEYIKDLQYSGYLVDDGWARANEAVLVRFLRALLRGAEWLFDPANKDEANRLYAKEAELELPQVEIIYQDMIVQQMLSRNLRPNRRGIENIMAMAHEQGALDQVPPLDSWLDLSYLDKASR